MHRLNNKQIGLLAIGLFAIVALAAVLSAPPQQESKTSTITSTSTLPAQTAPSAAVLQQLQANPTFQFLVSYVDAGFQPSSLTVKAGDTVRFANNSSGPLWVASYGNNQNVIYPGSSDCGSSAFDSCQAIAPGQFWQFTFTHKGTWIFVNNVNKKNGATIKVE